MFVLDTICIPICLRLYTPFILPNKKYFSYFGFENVMLKVNTDTKSLIFYVLQCVPKNMFAVRLVSCEREKEKKLIQKDSGARRNVVEVALASNHSKELIWTHHESILLPNAPPHFSCGRASYLSKFVFACFIMFWLNTWDSQIEKMITTKIQKIVIRGEFSRLSLNIGNLKKNTDIR